MKASIFQSGVLVAVIAGVASAQTTLHTTTTLVVVPTLVQTTGKEPVFSLTADDFVLTDNGVPQKVKLEEETKPPLSLVVLMQTGGVARGQFASYVNLETMLASLLGGAPNKVSIVNFDSRPEGVSVYVRYCRVEERNQSSGSGRQRRGDFRWDRVCSRPAEEGTGSKSPRDIVDQPGTR